MAEKRVKIWYDQEGDYLEVIFDQKAGFFRRAKFKVAAETLYGAVADSAFRSEPPVGAQ